MKMLKDFAAFSVSEGYPAFFAILMMVTAWATSGVTKVFMTSGRDCALMLMALSACWILNAILIGTAVKLLLDAFSEFRANRDTDAE